MHGQNNKFNGVVDSIDPRIDPSTLTFRVRVLLDNPKLQLRPGMLMSVNIKRPTTNKIAIPSRSVFFSGNEQYVYVIDNKNIARQRKITTSDTINNQIIVTDGLNSGELIVY